SWVGEEAGQQIRAVLDALEPVAHDGGELVHAGDGEVAEAAFDVGPDSFGGGGGVGGVLDDGQPGPAGGQLTHRGADMGVEVVPDHHDRGFEVLVGGVEQ